MCELYEEHQNCDCHSSLMKTNIVMPEKCHIIHEDYLDLFVHYKEKAEKWDKFWKYNPQLEILLKSFEENKRLKEELDEINHTCAKHALVTGMLKQQVKELKELLETNEGKN